MNDRHHVSLTSLLGQLGRPEQARGLRLAGAEPVLWLVERGHVDVFLVATGEDGGAGARSHLYAVGPGQLLSLPTLVDDGSARLALAPGPDCAYRVLERAELLAALEAAAPAEPALAAFDQLAASLGQGFAGAALPKCLQLEAGLRQAGADQTLNLTAAAPGLWLELEAGQADYLGRVALQPEQPLPLPPGAWVTLAPEAALRAVDSAELAARYSCAALLASLDRLAQLLLDVAIARRQASEADELNRLQRQRELGHRTMADALASFVALFQNSARGAAAAADANYILAGCRLIGAHQGITFKPAPPPVHGARSRDPVKDIAQASGVRTRIVALKGQWWCRDNGALLVFPEQGRGAYALLPTRAGGYRAIDAASGAELAVDAAFIDGVRSFAYTFYAGLPEQALGLRDLLRFISFGVRRDIATVAAIGLASALLGMAIPIASGHLFDHVFPAAERGQMVQIVAVLFIASLVTLLFEATRSLAMLRIEGKAGSDLQAAVWDRVLKLPVPFFRDYTAGDLATRINGINEIRKALSGTVISSIVSSLFSVLNVALLFYYSVRLALLAMLLVALALGINLTLGYLGVRVRRAGAGVNGKVAGLVLEYLSGITKLRITGAESRAFANWAAGFAEQKQLALRAGRLANVGAMVNAAYPVASNALIFAAIGAALAQADGARLSTGQFIAFSASWTLFLDATLTLVRTGVELLAIAPVYERTRPILETVPEVAANKPYPGTLDGAIELSRVSFSYAADGPQVLDDVTLNIAPGEFVALVGASGSGKSTLLRLMLGFERPSQGGIYYDGHNLDEVDVGAVRRQLGVVLQGGRLMSGDIYTNIIGSHTLTLEDAWAAARACGLDQDISAMPMGMHTMLSDGGGTLSGGQRQRLLIARAIVNQPRIIYFDEATSALDNQSQAIVSASMEQLRATRVVIAHRLSTIINADRIYVMERGRIVQSGSYEQLMRQDGLFADLAKRQMA